MIHAIDNKLVGVVPPAAIVDNATLTVSNVDTLGFSHCQMKVYIGATDIALTALKLQECDTTDGTFVDISGTVYGTDDDIAGSASVLPSATDDNKFFAWDVDLRGRMRFIKLVATVGDGAAGAYVCAWAELSRSRDLPVTASERGCANILRV